MVLEATKFVGVCWLIYERYQTLVHEALEDDSAFMMALDKGMTSFINSVDIAPSLLALFFDSLLNVSHARKLYRGEGDDATDALVERGIRVFRYVSGKDMFERVYCSKLACRAILESSVSLEKEEATLLRLRETCGYVYTSRLQRMLADVVVCKDDYEAYLEEMSNRDLKPMETSVLIMSNGAWPLRFSGTRAIFHHRKRESGLFSSVAGNSESTARLSRAMKSANFPPHLGRLDTAFGEFYNKRHPGRKFSWVHSLSRVVIRAHWDSGTAELETTITQASVLLLFNSSCSWSAGDAEAELSLGIDVIQDILLVFQRIGVLEPTTGASYRVASKPPKRRGCIRIVAAAGGIGIADASEDGVGGERSGSVLDLARGEAEEDRRVQVQAAIVRIMKGAKELGRNEVTRRVIEAMGGWFKPSVSDVKVALEELVEKEYLLNAGCDSQMYQYVS